MRRNLKWIKFGNILLYITYFLLVFETFFGNLRGFSKVKGYFSIIEIAMLLFSIVLKYTYIDKKQIFLIILIISISVLSFLHTKNSNIMFILLFFIASKELNFKKFLSIDVFIKMLYIVLLLFFLSVGLMENTFSFRENGKIRYTFGLNSPNTLGAIVLCLCMEVAYIKYQKLSIKNSIVFIALAVLVSYITASRASSFCLIIIALAPIFKNKIYLKNKLPYIFVIFTIFSFVLLILYEKNVSWINSLDKILSYRIKCSYGFWKIYPTSIFGNKFADSKIWLGYANSLDNAYLDLIIHHGLLMYMMIFLLNMSITKRAIKDNDKLGVFLIIVMEIYALMERAPFTIIYNVFWLIKGNEILGEKNEENINNNSNL